MLSAEPATDIHEVVEEFGRLLDVLARQLGASVLESDHDYLAVGAAFQELALAKSGIDVVMRLEPDDSPVRRGCERIGKSLDAAVVALQYHDRLAQRVGHIRVGLDRLQTLLRDGRERSYDEWLDVLRNVERDQALEQRRLSVVVGCGHVDDSVEIF